MDMSNIKAYSAIEAKESSKTLKKNNEYGKTIGEPKLSEEAKKYYDSLKEKYGNMDFILVDSKSKDYAQANAAKYANVAKTVVLIDEEKIERMATDEAYRKKYEAILSGATTQLSQMKEKFEGTGANIKGYGIQINDDGTASYFAVLQKASDNQRARIEAKAEEKKAEKKKEAKEARKEQQEKWLEEKRSANAENTGDITVIKGNSVDELLNKIQDFVYAERGNVVRTEAELVVGQRLDVQV
ncbi:MAG: hypothetical protein J6L69_09160 [Lachnospiraceae bacterium]|nr:hypothetical protein [Lachnospiraceae bacterium]